MQYLKWGYKFLALSIVTLCAMITTISFLLIGENRLHEFDGTISEKWNALFEELK